MGIEWDDAAVATREAAGLPTLQGDVARLDPVTVAQAFALADGAEERGALRTYLTTEKGREAVAEAIREHGPVGVRGLIASPPCQAWSMAGKGIGRTHDVEVCERAVRNVADVESRMALDADGLTVRDLLATYAEECQDPRSILVAEPMRWTLELLPTWTAWEQVPPVLGYWELCAELLRQHGYTVWTGLVSAEQYGVPQTRRRAILLAARDGRPVGPPPPTHRRYLPPKKLDAEMPSLFDAAEFQQHRVHPEDEHLRPWVSMADALGWSDGLVGFPRRADDGTAVELDGETYRERDLRGTSEPAQAVTEKARSWTMRANAQTNAAVREADEPAPTITGGHDTGDRVWEVVDTGNTRGGTREHGRARMSDEPSAPLTSRADQLERRPHSLRARTHEHDVPREADEPAPTMRFGARANAVDWVPSAQRRDAGPGAERDPRPIDAPSHYDRRQGVTEADGSRTMRRPIPTDEPAPTIGSAGLATGRDVWVHERPATTVAGDSRVQPPGHKINADDEAAGRTDYDGRAGKNAVRVSVHEAAILQSFPPSYPWQGTRTKQFEQIGNAVPPMLAAAVLAAIAQP